MTYRTVGARLAAGLIVIVLAACDNVEWGGADVVVVPPNPQTSEEEDAAGDQAARLPDGPVLYHVRVADGRAAMAPVAEIAGDSLVAIDPGENGAEFGRRLIAQRLRRGTEFALFHRDARVATLAIESATLPEAGACPALPWAVGTPEFVTGADTLSEFLALSKAYAPEIPSAAEAPLTTSRGMQVVAPILAEQLLRARAAPLPGSWSNALGQLRPLRTGEGDAAPGFAATFLTGDTLGPGLDDEGQALFLIAEPRPDGTGYDSVYADHRTYEREGKAAPRVIDVLDWNRDGRVELLLEVYGTDDRWFEAVGRVDGEWRHTFRGRCDRPGTPATADDTAPDGADPDTTPQAPAETARRPPLAPSPAASSGPAPGPERQFPEPQIELSAPAGGGTDRTS